MFRESFRTYRYTTLALLLGLVALNTAVVFEGAVFEALAASLAAFSGGYAGDLLLVILTLSVGFALDMQRRAHRRQRQNEQLRNQLAVLRATLVAVNDIVLEFLGHLQSFRQEIDTHPGVPAESLADLDDRIHTTSAKLRHLGNIDIAQIPGPGLGTDACDELGSLQEPAGHAEPDAATQSCGPR